MKKPQLLFSFLLLPLDFIMIFLAGLSAYYIRYADFFQSYRPAVFDIPVFAYSQIVGSVSLLCLVIFAFTGLYSIKNSSKYLNEVYRIILACSTGLMAVVITIFIRAELFNSRFIILAAWILAIIYLVFYRGVIRLVEKNLYKYGIGVTKVLLVGDSKTTDNLIREFSSKKNSGYEVIKRLRNFSIETAQELAVLLETKEIDEIIQADPNMTKVETLRLYNFTDEHHITFKYAADLLDIKVLRTEVADVAGIPVVEVKKTPLEGWGRIVKRIFDVLGSIFLIIIFSPIMIVAALMIKLDSKGPLFFSKRDDGSPLLRIGQSGKPFKYFKFRSMLPNTDNMRYNELADRNLRSDGPMVKIQDDPRVTRVGRFIRRYSIDELSEFFLVFMGRMSLVGPRPHLPEEVAKYELHHKKVLTVKPGITGMAQISGRSDLSFEDEVRLDTYYIENWSLLLDLSILFRTPLAILRKRETE